MIWIILVAASVSAVGSSLICRRWPGPFVGSLALLGCFLGAWFVSYAFGFWLVHQTPPVTGGLIGRVLGNTFWYSLLGMIVGAVYHRVTVNPEKSSTGDTKRRAKRTKKKVKKRPRKPSNKDQAATAASD